MNVKLVQLNDILEFQKDGGKLNRHHRRKVGKLKKVLRNHKRLPNYTTTTLPDAPQLAVK